MDITTIIQSLVPAEVLQILLSGGVIAAVPVVVQLHIQSKGKEAAALLTAGDKVWMAVIHGQWLAVVLAFMNGDLVLQWAKVAGMRAEFYVGLLSTVIEGGFAGLVAAGGVSLIFTIVSKAKAKDVVNVNNGE